MKIEDNNINETQYSLHNPDNFNKNLTQNVNEILQKYIKLIIEYLFFSIENIKTNKNKFYLKFIITRGIETITNIFKNLLFYTKNISITYYHTQKSYYLYTEFISQIYEEQNVFLQLSSKDASMYVYKKTLFELHNDLKKNVSTDTDEKDKFNIINLFIELFKNIFDYFINIDDLFIPDKKNIIIDNFEKICNKINELNDNEINKEKINILYYFFDNLNTVSRENNNHIQYFEISEFFLKKIKKNTNLLNMNELNKKILNDNFIIFINKEPEKFINWMFNY